MTEKQIMTDVLIVGAGTAGLTAAVYAARAGKSVKLVEQYLQGGQIINASHVENFPGFESIAGFEFAEALYNQAIKMGAEIVYDKVTGLQDYGSHKGVQTEYGGELLAKAVILATGARVRPLGLENEDRFIGSGVSYCATCDGMLYRGRAVAVVGKSADAPEEANYLQSIGCRVTYVSDRVPEGLEAAIPFVKAAKLEITGEAGVEALRADGRMLPCAGVFILRPAMALADLLPDLALKDGYIAVDRNMATNLPGVFAAGDCTGLPLQVSKAVGEGQVAGHRAAEYLDQL